MARKPDLDTGTEATPVVWSAFIHALDAYFSSVKLESITPQLHLVEMREGIVRIAAPADRLARWCRDETLSRMESVLHEVAPEHPSLAVTPDPVCQSGRHTSLSRFLVGPLNAEARARMREVLDEAGEERTPLVVWGPSGSGKTELLLALGGELRARGCTFLHIRAGELAQQVVAAIREDGLADLRVRLGEAGELLLDDVHQLAGLHASQRKLAQAALEVARSGRLAVLSSLDEPARLRDLDAELVQMLAGARVVALERPEWETRIAILMERFGRWEVEIAPRVAVSVATRLRADLADLDTLVTQAVVRTHGRPLEHPEQLAELLEDSAVRAPLRPADVVGAVARHAGLAVRDLYSSQRSARVTRPRQLAMFLVRHHCRLSYPEIGRRFSRHHTTVLHACHRIETERQRDGALHASVVVLEKELEQMAQRAGERRG